MDLVKIKPNCFEVNALTAFIQTLSGTNVYVDTKWSTPFKIKKAPRESFFIF
jgi:hypothetical protein